MGENAMKSAKRLFGIGLLLVGFVVGFSASEVRGAFQARAVPDVLVAAPDEYKLEFENEFVRVSRVKFPAHGKAPMHAHPSPGGVIVAITDQDARLTAPDGSTREVHYKAGQVRWAVSTPQVDATTQSAHAEENVADKPFELIRIDPKVR
jgi:hypothetical protein